MRRLLYLVCLLPILPLHSQVITTVAGSDFAFRGDGGFAKSAPLGAVAGLAVDAAGNLYVADHGNNLVVKITSGGVLQVLAGNGLFDVSVDDGPATSSSLAMQTVFSFINTPSNLAVDAAGNVYIPEGFGNRIRKVSRDGIITTVAGNTGTGFSGDGGPATSATLNAPQGVVIDAAGNLYIADSDNHRIRKVTPDGLIRTVAGNGATDFFGDGVFAGDGGPAIRASLSRPSAVAVDAAGNLYIADSFNHVIRKVTTDGVIRTVAGTGSTDPFLSGLFGGGFSGDGGPATRALLFFPTGVAVDGSGNLYIADSENHRIRKVSSDGVITTVAGSGGGDPSSDPFSFGPGFRRFSGDGGPAKDAILSYPVSVAVDADGNVIIADYDHFRVRRVGTNGVITTVGGNGAYGFAGEGTVSTSALLRNPRAVTVDGTGNLVIADTYNHRIRRVTPAGIISTVAGTGDAGFSGDAGLASNAALAYPMDVTVDGGGNVIIADTLNQRIRRVSPAGVISTLAGDGYSFFGGDGGPASTASFRGPSSATADNAGNTWIADTGNQRIRRIDSSGTISTVAGTGTAGFSGDGGPATGAAMRRPQSVRLDAGGNLFIADTDNHRIRRITSGGVMSTVAGTGTQGSSGDGGAATSATLRSPSAIATDGAGNLYLADSGNNRVRRVSAGGTITTIAGTGTGGYSGDGGTAIAARLNSPAGLALDAAGNLYIADRGNSRIRKVLAAPPAYALSPSTLRFSARAGTPAVAPQPVAITSTAPGLGWSASASESWLSVTPPSGTMPGLLFVGVNVASLAAGAYRGTVTVQAPLAAPPSTQTVAVELTVLTAAADQLLVDRSSVIFESSTAQGNPQTQAVRVSNAGTSSVAWTVRTETLNGGNWLGVTPSSGSASAGSAAALRLSANVSGLAPGVYSGLMHLESPGSTPKTVAVDLLLSQVTRTLLLTQTALRFTAIQGGDTAASQSLGIVNSGQGSMDWTATTQTVSGGNWLSVTPSQGQSDAGVLSVPRLEVRISHAGLAPGSYVGLVSVQAPGANNSPRLVTVSLDVLPAGAKTSVQVLPAGLIFAAPTGRASPNSQTVRLSTSSTAAVDARGQILTGGGGSWLTALPTSLTLSSNDPRTVVVQPKVDGLAPGEYRGALTFQFSDGSPPQAVDVFLLVLPAAGGTTALSRTSEDACIPKKLFVVDRSFGSAFTAEVGSPSNLEVQVVDDCGTAVNDATVVAEFSTGDSPTTLEALRNGLYGGLWLPANAGSPAVVTLRASRPPLPETQLLVQGQVESNLTRPAVFTGGVVNGASYSPGAPLAPGGMVAIFGRSIALSTAAANALPLPETLGGASVTVGGLNAPLFYTSGGQINAQLPFELPPNSRQQVVVKGAQFLTGPETITIAAARPGVFTLSQDGKGQGAILNTQQVLVDSRAPATAGEVVQVFLTGMGPTNPAVPSGRGAPDVEPLARVTTLPVQATVGGVAAAVEFAGLAPGFVGLYQVNVRIPSGVAAGASVPLVISQAGVPANTVTLAIR